MNLAVLSLGSNLGNLCSNLDNAIKILDNVSGCSVKKKSQYRETKPWGFSEQPDFLNCAVTVETVLSPLVLLGVCFGIESALGRERTFKNAPRIIDIDVLFYNDLKIDTTELKIPHPLIRKREFILLTLYDLLDEFRFFDFDFEQDYKKLVENVQKDDQK